MFVYNNNLSKRVENSPDIFRTSILNQKCFCLSFTYKNCTKIYFDHRPPPTPQKNKNLGYVLVDDACINKLTLYHTITIYYNIINNDFVGLFCSALFRSLYNNIMIYDKII